MNKKNCVLLFAAVGYISLLHAQKLPSTLLWKISGNGLQKTSYLYGTMHLTDERIFNLGDSLYSAIAHSDGFATEVDPAEFTPMIIDEAKKSYLDAVRIKDMMQADKFKKYGKLLAKKLNKNENDITTADILKEQNKWIADSYRNGKMQTFLDVYLFDIARRQGKWTGGVEDLKDQEDVADLIDESDIEELAMSGDEADTKKTADFYKEHFINAYLQNNLEAIDSISGLQDSLHQDAMLIKRNRKMAMRMDSLGHQRSMVFAVGAAHLPGGKGLIALLKEKGFTVTPVFSSKKIKSSEYKVAEVPLQWHDIKDNSGLYTASMPGEPGEMSMYGMVNMKMYFDVFSSTLYMTMALKTPYSQVMADSLFSEMTSRLFGVADYKKGKPLKLDDVSGREFTSKKDSYSHWYLLFKDGTMYMAAAMCMKKDSSSAPAMNRFLHSYTITVNQMSAAKGVVYTSKAKAYQVEVPGEAKSATDLVAAFKDSTTRREFNVTSDPVTGAYFFFGTNEMAPGYYIENDSSTLAAILTSQQQKFAKLSIDTTYINNGVRMMDLGGEMAKMPLMMKVHYQFRGNRWYALVAMYDTSKDISSVEKFFKSFTIIPYQPGDWTNHTSGDSLFSTWAPADFTYKPKLSEYAGETLSNYNSYDSARGDNVSVLAQGYNKYYWQANDSALWEELISRYQTSDSILYKKNFNNGIVSGYDLTVQESGSSNLKRIRLLLNGERLFTLVTVQAASEINNENNNKFFNSFHLNTIQSNANLFVSKAALLLKDIASPDTAVSNKAITYLRIAPFTKKDLPLLHQALLNTYRADTAGGYYSIKNTLERIIINLKDSSSFVFAKNNYTSAGDTTKNILLAIMASFPGKENYTVVKNILLQQTPRITPGYDLTNALTDSLQLTATIFPDLLPLLKDTVMASFIITITRKMLDSGLITRDKLLPYQPYLLDVAHRNYLTLKVNPDDYTHVDYNLENVIGRMNTAACNAILQQWSALPEVYTQQYTVNLLLKNKQLINPLAILALAKNKSTRVGLYDSLKAYKKENLFPVHYFTQKYFAESFAYASIDEDEEPSAIMYITQKIINFKGKQSRFYFYKVTAGSDENVRYLLTGAGPFPVNIAEVSSKNAFGETYYDDDYNSSDAAKQIQDLIKKMEDGLEWKNKNG